MLKILQKKIKKNLGIFGLIILILTVAMTTSYFNYNKKINNQTYNNVVNNIYLKKTLSHIVDNLEPKYKKIKHKIKAGETFDKILENYLVEKSEILKIKNSLKKK